MVRITSAGCIYEFPTLSFIDLYFCFYYKFFDATFVFDNVLDLKRRLSSSLKIWLISSLISRTDPGKMQHNLSFLLSGERTVIQAEVFCFFTFVFDKG